MKVKMAHEVQCGFCDECDGLHVFLVDGRGDVFASATLDVEEVIGLAAVIQDHISSKAIATHPEPKGRQ